MFSRVKSQEDGYKHFNMEGRECVLLRGWIWSASVLLCIVLVKKGRGYRPPKLASIFGRLWFKE